MTLVVISGVSALGKTTVARLLAERFQRTGQSAEQTVEAILADLDASRVRRSVYGSQETWPAR